MKSFLENDSKPKDWPVNNRDIKLEYVYRVVEQYRDTLNYKIERFYWQY